METLMSAELLELIVLVAVTFVVSILTLMTGFGIGTVLTPTFAYFYDVKTAVFLVSIVHLANNILKYSLFAKHVNKEIFKRFGLISIVGAIAGSFLQGSMDREVVTLILAAVLIVVGISEFLPARYSVQIPRTYDPAGGLLSGFLGGLIGNQGAIRSAYLLGYRLEKEVFVATATAISVVIDCSRIPIYVFNQSEQLESAGSNLLLVIGVAFIGTLIGKQVLKKISLERFRFIVAIFVIAAAVGLFL